MAAEKNTPTSGQSGLTPKQLAEQARAESEAAERRRERTIRIVGGLVVLLVVGGLLAVGFLAGRDNGATGTSTPTPTADPSAALPTGVSSDTYGVKYGSGWTSADEAKLPTLEIWEDFQCPACKQVEAASGAQIQELADAGKVKLLYRPATFLDVSLAADNQANGNPNSSARSTSAWGCAIDAGKTGEYHTAVFDIQPADEGVGFSDQQLIDLGTTVGHRRGGPGHVHQVRPGRHLPRLGGEQQPAVPRRQRRWDPDRLPQRRGAQRLRPCRRRGPHPEDRRRDRQVTGALATSIPSPDQSVWHLGPLPLRAYALCILVGIFVAMWVGDRRWVARGGNKGLVYDVAVWAVPFGIVGARLYHVLTDWTTYFGPGGSGLRGAVSIWEGGLAIWGAIALGAVGAWIGCRRHGVPLPPFVDALAVGVPLAQAIGRLGNWFNQELFGRPTDVAVGPGDRPGEPPGRLRAVRHLPPDVPV